MYRLASTQCINLLVQDDTSFVYHANIAPPEGAMSVIVRYCPDMSDNVRICPLMSVFLEKCLQRALLPSVRNCRTQSINQSISPIFRKSIENIDYKFYYIIKF